MIRIKYKELFTLDVMHNFYESGKSADFRIVPSAACEQILRSFGLRLILTPTGIKLFANVNTTGGADRIINPLPESTCFTFLLLLQNRNFANFTQLDLERPAQHRYYFNNLVNNISAAGDPLLVANTASKVVSNNDHLKFIYNNYTFLHTSPAAQQTSELRFIDSGESFTQTLQNNENAFQFNFQLQKTQGGRAVFFVEGVEKDRFFVSSQSDAQDLFGVVQVFHKASLNNNYKFQQDNNEITTRSYKIAFANRATRWRYVISRKFNQSITGVSVAKANGTPIAFSPLPGAPAGKFIMTSNATVPLRESPLLGIKLSDQANNLIIANLPNPSTGMITQEGTTIFSDVLVTI